MSRKKLIRQLKLKNQKLNQSELEEVLDIFSKSLVDSLKQGQNIELRGFGTFFVKRIKEKFSARNPKTGEIIYVPEKNKIRFKPSKKLKEYINK